MTITDNFEVIDALYVIQTMVPASDKENSISFTDPVFAFLSILLVKLTIKFDQIYFRNEMTNF